MYERNNLPAGLVEEAISTSIKTSPPIAVGAVSASGVSLEEWVFIVTLAYLALQILYSSYRFIRDLRRDQKERADG